MPQPHLRTRNRKRIKKALPCGENRTHFKREKPKAPSCTMCDKPIAGIPRLTPAEARKQTRSERRIWRPYGGQVCHNCLKNALKQKARAMGKH